MNKMRNLEVVNLPPGEMYLAKRPMVLQTILGSCVSATFWSPRLKIGALCHGVLPVCPQPWDPRLTVPDGYHYVDFSIRSLANIFATLGVNRDETEVKLFGGADVIPIFANRVDRPTVGALNAKCAVETVHREGFDLRCHDLKGKRGRKIVFNSGTGEVFVRKLRNHEDEL